MHQWYQEGLIFNKAYTSNKSYNQLMVENEIFASFRDAGNVISNIQMLKNNISVIEVSLGNKIASTDSNNLYWGINSTSQYPDLAAKFLTMMYTDEEIIKLYAWGVQGIDYTVDTNEAITWILNDIDEQWQSIAWSWPNGNKIEKYRNQKQYVWIEENDVTYISPANGFAFDSKNVEDEVAMCETVVDKYDDVLLSGYLDPDEVLSMFLEDLTEAGLDKVIEEKQKQLDQWFDQQ
jgi:putative aldouronate transport system substrate-binding protein